MIRPDAELEKFHMHIDAKPIGRPNPAPDRMGVDGSGMALAVLIMLVLVCSVAAVWLIHWLLGKALAQAAFDAAAYAL